MDNETHQPPNDGGNAQQYVCAFAYTLLLNPRHTYP